MYRNIKVHIKDKVAVAEGDPVIICGNSDYTVTFSFDDEWDEAKVKTARFNYQTADGPAHIDKPFEGNTVEVPELTDIRELEVGVFVDNLTTTTGATIRSKPSVRCGSGAPQDPAPDVYDELMELINQGGGGSGGGGGTLDGLPIYVKNTLPKSPKEGDIVALNTPEVIPWNKVKVWGRDELTKGETDRASIAEDLPVVGSFIAGEVPEAFDFGAINLNELFVSGVILHGSNGYIGVMSHNLGNQSAPVVQFELSDSTRLMYDGQKWMGQYGNNNPVEVSAHDIKLPDIFDAVVFDYTATMLDEEVQEYASLAHVYIEPALHFLESLGVIRRERGLYVAEAQSDGIVWTTHYDRLAKTVGALKSQTTGFETKIVDALSAAMDAQTQAGSAVNIALRAESKVSNVIADATEALKVSNVAQNNASTAISAAFDAGATADEARSKAITNEGEIQRLWEAVNGYSAFLEEINGEVVADE